MRTTLDIDDTLLRHAQAVSKARTKKEVVHRSLEALIREHRIQRLVRKLGRFPLHLTPHTLAKLRADG